MYHQIHPAKLATDVSTTILALVLLWHQRVTAALAIMLAPPIAVSARLVARGRLDFLAYTRAGRRMSRMTNGAMVLRLGGMLGMSIGAWRHDAVTLIAGGALIASLWIWVLR